MRNPIALLTDFGLADPYAGIMKAVILSQHPSARIVDLSHGVLPQDVRTAGFYLMEALPYFQDGTLFVCVVDPGVGSKRRILWARSDRHQFLAPDNGILSWAALVEPLRELRVVSNRLLFLEQISRTFHGRDIFAPVAAQLMRGTPPGVLGPRAKWYAKLAFPKLRWVGGRLRAEVLAVDRFGNAITNLRPSDIKRGASIFVRAMKIGPLRTHYGEVPPGRALALTGSSGFVEIGLREGNFSQSQGVRAGEAVYAR